MVRTRLLITLATGLLTAAVLPAVAAAHATLVRIVPADRSVLATGPRTVRFVFDDQIRPGLGIQAVRNGDGSVLDGKARAAGRTLVVPLKPRLPDGDYTVRWRAISDDGHELGGVVAFAVGSGRPPPVPGLSAGSTGPGAESIVSRWLFFLGLLAAAGMAVFHLVVWRIGVSEEELSAEDRSRLRDGERRAGALLLAGCFAAAGMGALLLLWLSEAALDTRFGRVITAGACLAGIGAATALLSLRFRLVQPLALAAALALLPLPTLSGHALDPGRSRLDLVVDVAHVTAAAVWVGGLLSLAVLVPRAAASLSEPRRAGVLRALARRFSTLALAAVALLLGTGIWRAVVELSAFSQLWTTGYGRAILVKSTLLLVILSLAIRNCYLLLEGPFARLRLGVLGESAIMLGVIVAVAFLTDLPPGRTASAAPSPAPAPKPRPPKLPPRDALVLAKQDGRLAVALAAEPAGRGVRVTATVVGPNTTGVDGLDVSFRAGKRTVAAAPCGSGCYGAVVPQAGIVAVTLSGRTVPFRLPTRSRSARSLVRDATAVFRSLDTVSYVERLSSGPGRTIVTDWRLQAPDRLAYAIRRGAAGIVIGNRRWDRTGGRWRESSTQRLRMPEPVWGQGSSNARLLRLTKRVAVVSMLDRSLPAWFTIRFDRRTLRPRSLVMTAAAHFMHHRYTSFDRPFRIRPPR
jgi:copper transport protein